MRVPCGSFSVSVPGARLGPRPPQADGWPGRWLWAWTPGGRLGEQREAPVARRELVILMDGFLVRSPWPPSGYFPGGLFSCSPSLVAFILFQSLR